MCPDIGLGGLGGRDGISASACGGENGWMVLERFRDPLLALRASKKSLSSSGEDPSSGRGTAGL